MQAIKVERTHFHLFHSSKQFFKKKNKMKILKRFFLEGNGKKAKESCKHVKIGQAG